MSHRARPGVAVIAPGIAVVNASSIVGAEDARRMVDACAEQLTEFCAAWSRLPIALSLYGAKSDVPPGMPLIVLVDYADDPGALAYHTEEGDGAISGIVGCRTCMDAGGGILAGGPSISSALSHEVLEAAVDPFVDLWCDVDGRKSIAFEVCDPVQDESYTIAGVDVSSYVLPAWFDQRAPKGTRFDRQGSLSAPFTRTAGGYYVQRVEGRTSQIGARAAHKAPGGRGAQRLAATGQGLHADTLAQLRTQALEHGAGVAQILADLVQRVQAPKRGARA
jgi:hypothetical protein